MKIRTHDSVMRGEGQLRTPPMIRFVFQPHVEASIVTCTTGVLLPLVTPFIADYSPDAARFAGRVSPR
ncbi:MAG: hypothetical protein ABIR61_01385 [Casimicrobiaceae bacterium]